MAGYSKTIIAGRLTRDPETRYTSDGTAVCNFTLVTSDEWRDKNTGEKKERPEFHRVVAWRKLGEICGQYLSKGRQALVEGRNQTRRWEQDGVTRYTTEIIANDVQFLGSKSGSSGSDQEYPEPPAGGAEDDGIPF